MTSSSIKSAIALSLIVFSAASRAGGAGSTALVHPGEAIPEAPIGMIWKVERHIQSKQIAISDVPQMPSEPILELVMVPDSPSPTRDDFKNTKIGGFLPPSGRTYQWRLIADTDGNSHVEIFYEFKAVLSEKLIIDETTRTEADSKNLLALPAGYRWDEQSRISNSTTLIPTIEGDLLPSKDKIIYVLKKERAELPDQVEIKSIAVKFGRNMAEVRQMLGCDFVLAHDDED
jgi:hypothetical protein